MAETKKIQRRWVKWSLILAGWTLLWLFFSSQLYLIYAFLYEKPISWGQALTWTLPDWYVWAVLALLILHLSRRFPFHRIGWVLGILLHVPASLLFALSHLVLGVSVIYVLGLLTNQPASWPATFKLNFIVRFHWDVLTYWAILAVSNALDYYRKYQERELRASQLEARLAQAQLEALKMQLHPHFLFNTLHAILPLIYKDPPAAERVITRLSDLLRLTLENAGTQEVSLKQELEFLERYLEIEQIRFGDRLTVRLDVAPETLDAQVPNLILQPLVENAIRHGIGPRAAPGRIEVFAKRDMEMLCLQVRDSGPGLPTGSRLKEGIGLANTRARLQQLYGSAHRFELENADDGGLVVNLAIPFHPTADRLQEDEAKGDHED